MTTALVQLAGLLDKSSDTAVIVRGEAPTSVGAGLLAVGGGDLWASGRITAGASTTSKASLHITPGDVPAAPTDGDMWVTASGLFVRINGVTQSAGGGGGYSMITQTGTDRLLIDGGVTTSATHNALTVKSSMNTGTTGVGVLFDFNTSTFWYDSIDYLFDIRNRSVSHFKVFDGGFIQVGSDVQPKDFYRPGSGMLDIIGNWNANNATLHGIHLSINTDNQGHDSTCRLLRLDYLNYAKFSVTTSGDAYIREVPYSWPTANPGSGNVRVLTNDGLGNLTWATAGGSGTIGGTIADTQVPIGSGTNTISGSSNWTVTTQPNSSLIRWYNSGYNNTVDATTFDTESYTSSGNITTGPMKGKAIAFLASGTSAAVSLSYIASESELTVNPQGGVSNNTKFIGARNSVIANIGSNNYLNPAVLIGTVSDALFSNTAAGVNALGNMIGHQINLTATTGSTSAINAIYGIQINSTITATGGVNYFYGIYIPTPTLSGTVSNNYSIKSDDTNAVAHFAGNIYPRGVTTVWPAANGAGVLTNNGSGTLSWATVSAGVTGSGTVNYIPKFTTTTAIGDSSVYDNGTTVVINNRNFQVWDTVTAPTVDSSMIMELITDSGGIFGIRQYSSSPSNGPGNIHKRARGTEASPSAVTTDDLLGTFGSRVYHSGGSFSGTSNVAIRMYAAESATAGAQGTYMDFQTTATGTTTCRTVARFNSDGSFRLGSPSSVAGKLILNNASGANTVTLQTGTTATSYVLSFPTTVGSATSILQNDGSGNFTWVTSFAPTAHVLDSATHTISGKTAGQVLLATSGTAYAFTTISGDATISGSGTLAVDRTTFHVQHGFNAASESTIAFDPTTRRFTITPTGSTFRVFRNGAIIDSAVKTIDLPSNTTGAYFITMNSDGTLAISTTVWNLFTDIPVAEVYYYAPSVLASMNDERHTAIRNRAWHQWGHTTIGTRYVSGLTGTFGNNTFSMAQGRVADEDIVFDTGGAKTSCRLWRYSAANSVMYFTEGVTTPYLVNAGTLQYDNAGNPANVGAGNYVINDVYATTDPTYPIWIRVGDTQYGTLNAAQAALSGTTTVWQNLPTAELKILYRVIYRNAAGTPTFIQASDFRSVSSLSGSSSGTSVPLHASTHSAAGTDPIISLGSVTFTGEVVTPASTTTAASLNIPHGTAPTTGLTNGDIWTDTTGLYARINGTTVGPFTNGVGGSIASTQIAYGTGTNTLGGSANLTWNNSTTQMTIPFNNAGDGGYRVSDTTFAAFSATESWIGQNIYYSGGWKNRSNNFAGMIYFYSNKISIMTAAAAVVGAITPVAQMEFRSTGLPAFVSSVSPTVATGNDVIFGAGRMTMPNQSSEANLRCGDGGFMIQSYGANDCWFGSNFVYNGSQWVYRESNVAQRVYFYQGKIKLSIAVTGSVGGTVTWIDAIDVQNTGKVNFLATATTAASINVPHGTAPTSPVNGDIWTTTAGLYAQINSTTVGPFGTATGTIGGSVASTQIAYGSGTNTINGSSKLIWSNTPGTMTIAQGSVTTTTTGLAITSTWAGAAAFYGIDINATITNSTTASRLLRIRSSSNDVFGVTRYGRTYISPLGENGTLPDPALSVTATGGNSYAATFQAPQIDFNLGTLHSWADGTVSEQRGFRITATTYDNAASGAFTTAATVAISGAPIQGTNTVITNAYALWIEKGLLALGTKSAQVGQMAFNNATNGNAVTIQSGVTSGSYTLTLPLAQGGASTFLQNNGSGVLSWAAASGITGSGTTGKLTKWTTGGTVIGDSLITESTNLLSVAANVMISNATGTQVYFSTTETNTGTGSLVIQAGAGSADYGGGICLFARAHATNPGDVWIGASSGAGDVNIGVGVVGGQTTHLRVGRTGGQSTFYGSSSTTPAANTVTVANGYVRAANSIYAGDSIFCSNGTQVGFMTLGTGVYAGSQSNHAFVLRTNNTDRVSILASGVTRFNNTTITTETPGTGEVLIGDGNLWTSEDVTVGTAGSAYVYAGGMTGPSGGGRVYVTTGIEFIDENAATRAKVTADGFNIVPVTFNPTQANDGDIMVTSGGMFVRINGQTTPLTGAVGEMTISGSDIYPEAASGDVQTVTLTSGGVYDIRTPYSPRDGTKIIFRLIQGGMSASTVTWDVSGYGYQFSTAIPQPTLSTSNGSVDYVAFIYYASSGKWHCIGTAANGYT